MTYNKAMMDYSPYSQYWSPQHQWKYQQPQFQATPPPPEFLAAAATSQQYQKAQQHQATTQQYQAAATSQQHQAMTQQYQVAATPQQHQAITQQYQVAATPQQYQAAAQQNQATTPPQAESYQPPQYMAADNPVQSSNPPEPLGLKPVSANHAVLPSSAIQSHKLLPVSKVLEKYPKLLDESNAGNLAQKLAKEAFFGVDVMIRCTPTGIHGGLPALPQTELFELKKAIFRLFPRYHRNPSQFEGIWKRCFTSIAEACKRLR